MLRRLFLALLMICIAAPSAAAPLLHGQTAHTASGCHEVSSKKAHQSDSGAPMVQHDGICCAAFYGAPAAALPSPPALSPAPRAPALTGLAQPRAEPDAPPPKF